MNIAEQVTKVASQLAEEAQKNGANGIMLLPPMRYKASEKETVTHMKTVANAIDIPVMIYNNPHDYKIEVTLDMFEELATQPNIEAIKKSTRDVSNIIRLKNKFGGRFKVLCGIDTLIMEALCIGADGIVGGLVNAFPEETVALEKLVAAGKLEEARKLYYWFLPLLELDIHPKLVQYIKLAAKQTGIGSENVRAPRLILEGTERESVLNIINTGIATKPALSDYLNL